jgi:MYXO-CTERM domain-containing protein
VSGNGQCPGLGNGNDVGVPSAFQACVTPNPGSAGLLNNQFVTVNFTGNSTVNSGAEVHIQNVNGTNCSVHVNLLTMVTGGSSGDCGTTTTPEPASMALVATGLLALGGSVVRRRRRE